MKDLWNGMFDFNGDGRMDIGEEYLAYRIFEAVTGSRRAVKRICRMTKRTVPAVPGEGRCRQWENCC